MNLLDIHTPKERPFVCLVCRLSFAKLSRIKKAFFFRLRPYDLWDGFRFTSFGEYRAVDKSFIGQIQNEKQSHFEAGNIRNLRGNWNFARVAELDLCVHHEQPLSTYPLSS